MATVMRELDRNARMIRDRRRFVAVDYDGTITEQDLLQKIAYEFGDPEIVGALDRGLGEGTVTLRDEIVGEYATVRAPLEEVLAWAFERTMIRPGFREFIEVAGAEGWRVVVVSSGFHELIEPVLEREGVDVLLHANRVDATPQGWQVDWRYPDDCDHCGESCKRTLLPAGYVVYVGDGYSDRCAALASDRVFATSGLARYLSERGTPFETFSDFRALSAALANRIVTPPS